MKQSRRVSKSELHSNRMLVATLITGISLLVQLLIHQGLTHTGTILIAMNTAHVLAYLLLAAAVLLGALAVVKNRSFWEYAILALALAVGYYVIHGVRVINVGGFTLFNSQHWEYVVLGMNLLYLVLSLIGHSIAARRRKRVKGVRA